MSMGSEWDERLRVALLEAARLDGEAALAALPGEPDFSREYLRARKRLLHNPFRYARRRSRFGYKAVLWYAACALVTLCLSAALVLAANPAARAWVVRMWNTWRPEYTEYQFQGDGTEPAPLGVWRPTYVPEGYVEWDKHETGTLRSIYYVNKEKYLLSLTYRPVSNSGSMLLDNEHSIFRQGTVHDMPADLYIGIEQDDVSTVIWVDESKDIIFSVDGVLDEAELLRVAESIALIS